MFVVEIIYIQVESYFKIKNRIWWEILDICDLEDV